MTPRIASGASSNVRKGMTIARSGRGRSFGPAMRRALGRRS